MKNLTALFVILMLILFGCGGEQKEPGNTQEEQPELKTGEAEMTEGINIAASWVRPSSKGSNTGMFFRVSNNGNKPDTLFAAESNIAEKTEVHETFQQGEDMMGMREVEHIVIEPGETFDFKPMAYHIMLINLNEDLEDGDSATITLQFKNAGMVSVTAPVEDKMPVGDHEKPIL